MSRRRRCVATWHSCSGRAGSRGPTAAPGRDTFHERSFGESAQIHQAGQGERSPRRRCQLVARGGTVFLDAGTTCLALARRLDGRGPLTVVTRGLETALLLARLRRRRASSWSAARSARSAMAWSAPLSALSFDRLAFDVAFLGADAVDPGRGSGSRRRRRSTSRAGRGLPGEHVVVLADSSKLAPANSAGLAATRADLDPAHRPGGGGIHDRRLRGPRCPGGRRPRTRALTD